MSVARRRAGLVALAVMAGSVGLAAPSGAGTRMESYVTECGPLDQASGTRECNYFFHYSQTIETFVVPPSVGPVRITAVGAPGAGSRGLGSYGAKVTGSLSSLSGMPLFVAVGGEGWFDGYNGGGMGGGGGASDVRLGLPELDHRIIVAGGGGGWGEELVYDQERGKHRIVMVKGGDAGQSGQGAGGKAGTATAGGLGGGNAPAAGRDGVLGRGGAGAGVGGGGGGGLYGGGGGGGCWGGDGRAVLCGESKPGSGGGGSSLVPSGGTVATSTSVVPIVIISLVRYG